MRLKKGSKWTGLKPEILLAVMVADSVYSQFGHELVLTEGTGGKHMNGSKHYIGDAVDIRTNYLTDDELRDIVDQIRDRLTVDFDVVVEATHLHLEFDPK